MITAITAALFLMTSYGIWLAFGPPSKQLDDTFDDHEH
tara:strand:+ start:1576 stop:1689 length:114 start_codon:yes stop_codon:yes gene_type:complete